MDAIISLAEQYLGHIPYIQVTDIIEILIISFVVYHIMVWLKDTRAWVLVRGVLIILVFIVLAALFEMNTILWIVQNVLMYGAIAVVVVLQPELRKALEQIGKREFLYTLFPFDPSAKSDVGFFSDQTLQEITRACVEMGRKKTGALIVIEQRESLEEIERTGIQLDGIVTSQLLMNVFFHNSPLHDGAAVIRGDRITYATCYLRLSENLSLSKDLGTRHRAGVGASEDYDALVVIVSEETGKISVASGGKLQEGLSREELEECLRKAQRKPGEEAEKKNRRSRRSWKGWLKHEKTK